MSSKAGHHGDLLYVFEDAGFDTTPNDTTVKVFGSNLTADTLEGGHNAARIFNADRYAADIISQLFDGSWSVSFELSEPPWWLAAVFGQPTSTNVSGSLYEFTYNLTNSNDPVSLRLYAPTDGFSNYVEYAGAVIASVSVSQTPDDSPEVTITGAYARQPADDNTVTTTVPNFGETTFSNRHAEMTVGGSTVGRSQNATVDLQANTELINEIGSENAVDYIPRQFNPDATINHILWESQTVDFLQRFRDETQSDIVLKYDNGETGDATYTVDLTVTDSFPDQWSESGRNDPEADLIQELQEMGEVADVVMQTSEGSGDPPGITL